MPQVGQIIPEHLFPYNKVVVNDNTEYTNEVPADADDSIKMIFVFASPKGRDNKVITIDGGLKQFISEFGQGAFSLYGQPYLNAYNAFGTGNIVGHCLRVSAPNATYAYSVLVALYKIDASGKMSVKFKTRTGTASLEDINDLDSVYTAPTSVISDGGVDDGYTEVKLFTIGALGRGSYGNKICYSVSSNSGSDKENNYKNYVLAVYENNASLELKEQFYVCFNDTAIVDGEGLFADGVLDDVDTGSSKIKIVTDLDGFNQLYTAYADANPDTSLTLDDFDPLLGINKYTRGAISNYEIDTVSTDVVVLNALGGIALTGGDDGDLAENADPVAREAALKAAYVKAWSGETDEYIKSKNRFPANLILDANFEPEAKAHMAALVEKRGDCMLVLDCGTEIKTKISPIKYVKNNIAAFATNRLEMVDAICGKVRDPYSKKIVTVTETALLASEYPNNWAANGGKHIPFAGNNFGILNGFIKNSIYPVYDEDLDADIMDELVDERINFARINASQNIVRATQTTRQTKLSNLSEASNMFILLDIKRDCERMCDEYQYNFSEPEDIAKFNKDAETILAKYAESQVRSIQASFNKNDWEATRGILHLYVGFEHKDLVKTSIIEIDVNRGSVATTTEE